MGTGECTVSYSLPFWCSLTKYRPTDQWELFNLHHASTHNVIECAFGVLKKRFRILLLLTHYPLDIQARIPVALCVVHNFIMLCHPSDKLIDDDDDPMGGSNEGDGSGDEGEDEDEDEDEGDVNMRNRIAHQMWDNYVELLHA